MWCDEQSGEEQAESITGHGGIERPCDEILLVARNEDNSITSHDATVDDALRRRLHAKRRNVVFLAFL